MHYTLYIDESGDFVSQKGQWVLAGVLFTESYDNCERLLTNKLKNLPQDLGLDSIKQFHLTEFRRKYNPDKVTDIAKKVLHKLDILPFDYSFLATINFTKTSLSHREKTYRLMLFDLLALCETAIGENNTIDNLDLIVATRTINGEIQTTISNINKEIISSLPNALEVDLATRGMVDLIGKHIKVKMDYANNSWGLVYADFIANLSYHNRKEKEKKLFEELYNKKKYILFESFGGFEVRRANIAERDNDYILSLYRWLIIKYKQDFPNSDKSIQRLLYKIFYYRGTSGYIIEFEAVLERLWRNFSSFELLKLLNIFEKELVVFFNKNNIKNHQFFLFRVRNAILIIVNHLGDTNSALEIIKKQENILSLLISNPDYFKVVLDYKIIEIEVYINLLDFQKSLELAQQYSNLISNYKEIWNLLLEEENLSNFIYSRANIKSEMTLFRCYILNLGIQTEDIELNFMKKIKKLETILTNKNDISRFKNYKIMLLLKQNKPQIAVNYFIKLFEQNELLLNEFDFFWFLKSVNNAFLLQTSLDIDLINKIIKKYLSQLDINKVGHPFDLIYRELALYEFNLNNKSKALKYIKKSRNKFNLTDSNISYWLKSLLDIHEDYINGKDLNNIDYFGSIINNDFIDFIKTKQCDLSFLNKVRYFSPY